MQITVKETRVVKTGTNKSGDWELIRVTSEDNTEYTTFDKKAKHLASGSIIDIGEPIIKEGKISFKEYTVISAPATPVKGNGYPDMSKEDWAEKQRVERESIEAQTAVKTILSLVGAFETEANSPFRKIVSKALDWCEAKIDATMKDPVKPPVKAPGKAPQKEKPVPINPEEVEFDDSPVKNFGELWTRCKTIGVTKEEGLGIIGVDNQILITDLNEAWKTIYDSKFGKQEEVKSEEAIN